MLLHWAQLAVANQKQQKVRLCCIGGTHQASQGKDTSAAYLTKAIASSLAN